MENSSLLIILDYFDLKNNSYVSSLKIQYLCFDSTATNFIQISKQLSLMKKKYSRFTKLIKYVEFQKGI